MHRTRHIKNINILNWKRAGRQEETPSTPVSKSLIRVLHLATVISPISISESDA